MALWSGRPTWLGKLSIAVLVAWFLVLILSVSHLFKYNNASMENALSNDKENSQRLTEMAGEFEILKKQNEALAHLLLGHQKGTKEHASSAQDRAESSIYFDLLGQRGIGKFNEPSADYEELRKRIENNVQEMWYYVHAQFNKMKKNVDVIATEQRNKEIEEALKMVWEHKKSLMIDMEKLANADGHQEWREKEAKDLSDLVQRRFRYLQNPADCNKAKKLICSLNKGCGFGCQIHHLTYCFLVAYGTERTLILKSRGWRYHKDGWESVFKPVSDTCLSTSGGPHSNWPGDSTKQIVSLPIVDNVYPKPKFQPPSVPADIAPRLEKIHGHPIVWWVGQVLKYLLRPQENVKKLLDYSKEKLGFAKPIVGIHVRRTDKVGTEAAYHDIDEYMVKVDQYFDQMENPPKIRRVFVASDDPKVITDARQRYAKYEIIGDPEVAETASVSRRYSDSSLQGIIVDIHLLSQCDFLVCTFSSQVCRVAYELMQTYHTDAYNRFASLDDVYYYGGQNPHPHVAILDHKPRRPGEIDLRVGDLIEVYGNHWDGFSKGRNTRTSMTGLYPSFKVKNRPAAVEFPKYPNVPLLEEPNS